MKVFIPMSDELLDGHAMMAGTLVPFNPEFLSDRYSIGENSRPLNWVSESNYSAARERLASKNAAPAEATAF